MMQITNMKKKPLHLILLYNFRKVIGMWSPLYWDEKANTFSNFRLCYSITLCTVYSVLFYWIIIERINLVFPKETITAIISDGIIDVVHFCMVITSWLTFAIRQKKILEILDIIKKTDLNGRALGIADNCEKNLKTLSNRTLIVVCVFLGRLTSYQALAIRIAQGNSLRWMIFKIPHIVNHLLVLIFITNLEIVRLKFYHMNIRLRHLPSFNLGRDLTLQETSELRESMSISALLIKYGKFDENLKRVLIAMSKFYGLPILIAVFVLFFQTTAATYAAFRVVENDEGDIWTNRWIFYNCLVTILFNFVELYFMSASSEALSEEARNTGIVLHKMWVDYQPPGCEKMIKKLSLQLLQRQLSVSLYGFVNLDLQFFYRICATITTYLIIMVQLDYN